MIFYDNGMISAEQLDLETPVILLHKKIEHENSYI